MKQYTNDGIVENPKVEYYDDKGSLLAAKVSLAVVVNATLVVCVDVDAEADINIVLAGVLDENKDGKKDTIHVLVDILAKVDLHAKISAKVHGKVGLFVGVALYVDAHLFVGAGEKKTTYCKGKDGLDTY